jgi:integrase/recombinase XerC
MTITGFDIRSGAPGQAMVDAALLLLERMGLRPADLLATPAARPTAPTFAEYIPVMSALVSGGCRKTYGSYWNRVTDQWGSRRIDEPTPSEIRQLVQHVRANVPRRNSRGGRSVAEHLIAALRCMYKHAEKDGLIDPADKPARKVEKPRRPPSTRRPVADPTNAWRLVGRAQGDGRQTRRLSRESCKTPTPTTRRRSSGSWA